MLPAVSGPAVFFFKYLILFGFARLTGGKNALVLFVWTGSMLYEGVLFRQFACSICSRYYCVSYLLLLGAEFLAGGREGGGSRSSF